VSGAADRLEQLRAEARHHQQKRDLYRARSYGMQVTSEARLRELERVAAAAQERLAAAEAGAQASSRGAAP
jgi:hypothetical protein